MSFRAKKTQAISVPICLCFVRAGVFLGLCANRHGQEGMDQSGSPRWLVTSDPWQASAICAVATCKIPAASSSVWVEEAADATAVDQSPECPRSNCGQQVRGSDPGIPRSAPSQRTQKRGRLCNPRWRRPNDKRRRFLPRRSTLPERKALQKAEHGKEVDVQCVADGERSLEKIEDTSCRSDDADFFSCGSCWRSHPSPANGCGVATTVAHSVPVVPPQGVLVVPSSISPFCTRKREDHVPATEHEELEVDGRPSRGNDCCSKGQESHRSGAHEATRRLQPESVPPSMGTASKEARTISRYGLARFPVGEASDPGPHQLRRLRRGSQSSVGQSLVDVSSDEEPLVRPNMGRDVLPRVGEGRTSQFR